jgi:hypothetical protein
MSLQSIFTAGFKNFGHAIAVAAKYTAIGIKDVISVANKAQKIEPEVEMLVTAFAGPIGANVTSLAFHALGDVANAIEPLGNDALAQASAQGLNIQLDVQTLNDIKAVLPQLKAIIAALGGALPAATGVKAAVPQP